ncbi:hypothetical protein JL721_11536 [Aureococcus anophagefferens]|nr:hypothetical protein JL721_11536 [Aureococcus anophagefferens]
MTTRLARRRAAPGPGGPDAERGAGAPAPRRRDAGSVAPGALRAADLSESALRHCGRIAASRDGVTLAALKRGGWLCRASLVLQSTHHKIGSSDHHDAIDGACGFDPRTFAPREPAGSKSFVTVAVHHNGLGNQLFQYAMGRLLAWSLGSDLAAVLEIFDKSALGARRHAYDTCAELTPTKGEYLGNGTLLLAERPADTRRVRLAKQLEALLLKTADGSLGCVKTIGYFQQYAFFAGVSTLLRSWMKFKAVELTEDPRPDDVVVHVRLCDSPLHFYKYYSYENYFEHIFRHLEPAPARIRVVTGCDERKPGVVRELVERLGAERVFTAIADGTSKKPHRSVAADFLYMTRAKRLVVTESTYSWWAAYLGAADEVHAPASGVVPVPYQEPHYATGSACDAEAEADASGDAIRGVVKGVSTSLKLVSLSDGVRLVVDGRVVFGAGGARARVAAAGAFAASPSALDAGDDRAAAAELADGLWGLRGGPARRDDGDAAGGSFFSPPAPEPARAPRRGPRAARRWRSRSRARGAASATGPSSSRATRPSTSSTTRAPRSGAARDGFADGAPLCVADGSAFDGPVALDAFSVVAGDVDGEPRCAVVCDRADLVVSTGASRSPTPARRVVDGAAGPPTARLVARTRAFAGVDAAGRVAGSAALSGGAGAPLRRRRSRRLRGGAAARALCDVVAVRRLARDDGGWALVALVCDGEPRARQCAPSPDSSARRASPPPRPPARARPPGAAWAWRPPPAADAFARATTSPASRRAATRGSRRRARLGLGARRARRPGRGGRRRRRAPAPRRRRDARVLRGGAAAASASLAPRGADPPRPLLAQTGA